MDISMLGKTADVHLTKPMYTGEALARPAAASQEPPAHPLQPRLAAFDACQRDLELVRAVQGKAAALSLAMEHRLAGQSDRLPGLPSSGLQVRLVRGTEDSIGFEDQLNLACHSEVAGQPHALMEKRLGLL